MARPESPAELERITRLQITDPTAASQLWTRIDHKLTELAPGVVTRQNVAADLVSRRTHNYTQCWPSFELGGITGACLDQLWIR